MRGYHKCKDRTLYTYIILHVNMMRYMGGFVMKYIVDCSILFYTIDERTFTFI